MWVFSNPTALCLDLTINNRNAKKKQKIILKASSLIIFGKCSLFNLFVLLLKADNDKKSLRASIL